MNRKRLQILRKKMVKLLVKGVGNLEFDMRQWGVKRHAHGDSSLVTSHQITKAILGDNECGTQVCLAGVACTIPSFQRDGLLLVSRGEGYSYPQYSYLTKGDALALFFDLSGPQTRFLFFPCEYTETAGPMALQEAIWHLERLLAEGASL